MRGRKPKPTHLKLVEGNRSKRPLNAHEPNLASACPTPPEHLTALAVTEWHRCAPLLYSQGVLTEHDRFIFSAYCQSYALTVEADLALDMARKFAQTMGDDYLVTTTPNGAYQQNALIGIANTARRDTAKFAIELGLTPSARSRVQASPRKSKKDDGASEFFS